MGAIVATAIASGDAGRGAMTETVDSTTQRPFAESGGQRFLSFPKVSETWLRDTAAKVADGMPPQGRTMKLSVSREWVTPLTAGMFCVMAVTGLLMFFHVDVGLGKAAHEWLGWLLLAAVVAHGTLNWASLRRYLVGSRPAQTLLLAAALVLAGSLLVDTGGEPSPPGLLMRAVGQAPLTAVAPLTGKTMAEVQADLVALGLPAAGGEQTLQQLTGNDRQRMGEAVRVLFAR
jgi:hypothetical protein